MVTITPAAAAGSQEISQSATSVFGSAADMSVMN